MGGARLAVPKTRLDRDPGKALIGPFPTEGARLPLAGPAAIF